jgi:hypothetical protein
MSGVAAGAGLHCRGDQLVGPLSLSPFDFRLTPVYNLDMSASGQSVRSLIEGLPPEIAKRIHPDWRKNEAEYWAQRDTLLRQYADQWIGFAEGRVIVSGTSPVEVFHTAQASGKHPFVTRVGHENEPNRMRWRRSSPNYWHA